MNTTLIYIGNELVDLSPKTVVAQTLKSNDIGDLKVRYSNYTNTFKIPFTPNNHRIYEHSNNVVSSTVFPYRKQPVRIVQNGVEIVSDALHYISKSTDHYEVYIIGRLKDFFETIGEKELTDLSDHADMTGIDYIRGDLRSNTTGVCDAVMDQGDFYIDSGNYQLNEFNTYLASMYYHTIIDRIIADAGYEKSGSIFSNAKYLNMAVLCTGSSNTGVRYNADTFQNFRVEATNETGIATNSGATIAMPFTNVILNNSGSWDGAAGRYNISHPFVPSGKLIYRLRYIITVTVSSFSSPGSFRLGVSRNGAAPILNAFVDISTPGTYTIDMEAAGITIQGAVGDYHEVQLIPQSGAPVANITYGKLIGYITEFVAGGANTATFFNKLLPSGITQKEIMKHFLVSFGLLVFERGGTLIFKSLNEIIEDKANAKDWTSKRVASTPQIAYAPLRYAQNNYFRYSNSEEVINNEGEGNLTIDNDNAPLQQDFYDTEFSASNMVQIGDMFMMRVPVYELGVDIGLSHFQTAPGKRIYLIRDKYSHEPDIEFVFGSPESDYRVAYFSDPEQEHTMRWQQFVDQEYLRIGEALQKAKVVTREYYLTELDIRQIDFMTPIFDTDSYYLINGVKDFIPGQVTKVELLKI